MERDDRGSSPPGDKEEDEDEDDDDDDDVHGLALTPVNLLFCPIFHNIANSIRSPRVLIPTGHKYVCVFWIHVRISSLTRIYYLHHRGQSMYRQ